jgi:DegV family protein with EDD domain
MADFVIIPDSACDLSAELRQRFDIPDYVRGIVYRPDGTPLRGDMDWGEMDDKSFYESMSGKNALYKSAYAPAGEVMAVFEKYLSQGKDVLSVSLSTGLSGTYQAVQMAARELQEKYPARKIICIDSLRYGAAMGLLTILASQKRSSGATIEETAAYLEEIRHCIHQMGTMDDLYFLVKTGRISNFKAFFGTLVGVNAMADFNRQGIAQVLAKVKGKNAAFAALLGYMHRTIENPEEQIIFVAHSNREQAAQLLAEKLRAEFNPREIIIIPVGMSCGASIGPGLCAAFYLGKPVSEGLAEESALITSILQNLKGK